MDTQQLKLLAGRLRGYLEQNQHPVVYSKALDLVAAIPGLRNWPEVTSFPGKVAVAAITIDSVSRLARRLEPVLGALPDPTELLNFLNPPASMNAGRTTVIWSSGPAPGLYVTTSQGAIQALMEQYAGATDGAILYVEEAGAGGDNSIELGEYGLWSKGLSRIPSGTLLVVGTINMTQEEWTDNRRRLIQACELALDCGVRVAALFNTPVPANLQSDIGLLLEGGEGTTGGWEDALRGIVSDEGQMQEVTPFAAVRLPVAQMPDLSHQASPLPPELVEAITNAVKIRPFGLFIISSNQLSDARGPWVEATLEHTHYAGPACRIQPDFRGGYGKEPIRSDQFLAIPVLPSIQSAYASGYRRMIVEKPYGVGEVLLQYADKVCFLIDAYGSDVLSAYPQGVTAQYMDNLIMLQHVAAVLCITASESTKRLLFCDAFIASANLPADVLASEKDDFEVFQKYLLENRVIRWEDKVEELLDSGTVTIEQLKKTIARNLDMTSFLKRRNRSRIR